MIDLASPELLATDQGELIAKRYDVGAYLGQVLGSSWQEDVTALLATEGRITTRDLSHETCIDLGSDTPNMFELTTIGGSDLATELPNIVRVYRELGSLFTGQQDQMSYYLDPDDALEAYMQASQNGNSEVSRSMEPHKDGRFSGILAVKAPEGSGGELVVLDADLNEKIKINHISGTFIVFPRGRELPHYTAEMQTPNDIRVVLSMNYPDAGETTEQRDSLHSFVHNS